MCLPVVLPLIAGPVLCLMAIAVGLYVTRNQPAIKTEGR